MFTFDDPISALPRVTQTQLSKLHILGIYSIKDLVYHFPFRYDDYSVHKDIASLSEDETVTVRGLVEKLDRKKAFRKRMVITNATIRDHTGNVNSVWFNVFGPLRYLSEGKYVQISGMVRKNKKQQLYFQHPNFEIISKKQFQSNNATSSRSVATGSLVPIYPETKGITSYWIRNTIKKTLAKLEIQEFRKCDSKVWTGLIRESHHPICPDSFFHSSLFSCSDYKCSNNPV